MSKPKEEEPAVFARKVEQLLSNTNDWRNIQDIIRCSIKALCDVINYQGSQIKEIEKALGIKANKGDVVAMISDKANTADLARTLGELSDSVNSRPTMEEMQAMVEDKVSRADLHYFLNSKISMDDLRHLLEKKASSLDVTESLASFQSQIDFISKDFTKKVNQMPSMKDMSKLSSQLNQKANIEDVNEMIACKASKEEMMSQLRQKATKGDLEQLLKGKVDIEEVNAIGSMLNSKASIEEIDILKHNLSLKADRASMKAFTVGLNSKVEVKELERFIQAFNEFKQETSAKVNGIDQDFDRFIENIKAQFQSVNAVVSGIESSKADMKDMERLTAQIGKKADNEALQSSTNQLKFDVYESFNEYKRTANDTRKAFEKDVNSRVKQMTVDFESSFNLCEKTMGSFQEQLSKVKGDIEAIGMLSADTTAQMNQFNTAKFNELITGLNKKSDKKDFNELVNHFTDQIETIKREVVNDKCGYADLDLLYQSIEDKLNEIKEVNQKALEQVIKRMESMTANRLTKDEFDKFIQIQLEALNKDINDKVSLKDYEAFQMLCDNINHELMSKVDYVKFDALSSNFRLTLDSLSKEVNQKCSSSETAMILSSKVDTNEFKKALNRMNEQFKEMMTIEQFSKAQVAQSKINQIIQAENSIGRWQWNTGDMRNGYSIPWEEQTINTVPDNFYWEKNKTSLMIAVPGLYHIQLGLFSGVECACKLLINGEVLLISHATKNSFGEYKSMNTCESASINIDEFIRVPAKARVSVSFDGNSKAHGFLTIKAI